MQFEPVLLPHRTEKIKPKIPAKQPHFQCAWQTEANETKKKSLGDYLQYQNQHGRNGTEHRSVHSEPLGSFKLDLVQYGVNAFRPIWFASLTPLKGVYCSLIKYATYEYYYVCVSLNLLNFSV